MTPPEGAGVRVTAKCPRQFLFWRQHTWGPWKRARIKHAWMTTDFDTGEIIEQGGPRLALIEQRWCDVCDKEQRRWAK